jgi:16S rRNA (cytosine1402-N4)-methyltransferase
MVHDFDHQPVLLERVLGLLQPLPGQAYLDATAGLGGHAAAVLHKLGPAGRAVLVDRDEAAQVALTKRFGDDDRVRYMRMGFYEAAQRLVDEGAMFEAILLDLGVSSPQFDDAARGFSFKREAPLDMRMDQSQTLTAADVVNSWSLRRLETILRDFGEEPKARAVAAALVAHRPFASTTQLASIVRQTAYRPRDIDPATRTFQAIRMAVNNELEELALAVPLMVGLLVPGGRLAVISFHSLEDRIVKQFIDQEVRDCICPPKQPVCTCEHKASLVKITQRPVTADDQEIAFNPRARSAKLRAAEKINKNKRRD